VITTLTKEATIYGTCYTLKRRADNGEQFRALIHLFKNEERSFCAWQIRVARRNIKYIVAHYNKTGVKLSW
jgi:hypothetical protein